MSGVQSTVTPLRRWLEKWQLLLMASVGTKDSDCVCEVEASRVIVEHLLRTSANILLEPAGAVKLLHINKRNSNIIELYVLKTVMYRMYQILKH